MKNKSPRRFILSKNGSAFIVAVWALTFLSVLSVALASKAAREIDVASFERNKTAARFLAIAALRRAQHLIAVEVNGYDALNEPWSTGRLPGTADFFLKDVVLGDGSFSIIGTDGRFGLIDEERKLNINAASRQTLERLFMIAGAEQDEARALAASTIDWRDMDGIPLEGGAELEYYESLETPYRCRNANFAMVEELKLIKGMSAPIYQAVAPHLTVYGSGSVNANTAGEIPLRALGLSESAARKLVAWRRGEDGAEATADDNLFRDGAGISALSSAGSGADFTSQESAELASLMSRNELAAASEYFTVVAEGKSGRRREVVTCVVRRDGTVKSWREIL